MFLIVFNFNHYALLNIYRDFFYNHFQTIVQYCSFITQRNIFIETTRFDIFIFKRMQTSILFILLKSYLKLKENICEKKPLNL